MLWGGYSGTIPGGDPRPYYLTVIEREIALAQEYEDIREHHELYEALEHLRIRSPNGVRKFEKGLRTGDLKMLFEAKVMIERFS